MEKMTLHFFPLLLSTESHLKKNTKRSKLKEQLLAGFFSVFYTFFPLFFSCSISFPIIVLFGGWVLGTGRLGKITHISPPIFSVNFFQHLCVAAGRMWAPFQIQMRLISPSSG